MRPEDFPTARVRAKDTASRIAQVGAVLKHRGAIAGCIALHVVRAALAGSFVVGLLAWLAMHTSTTPHRYEVELPRIQIPQYDYAQMQRELAAIEAAQPVYVAPAPVVIPPPPPPPLVIDVPVVAPVKVAPVAKPSYLPTHEHAPAP